MPVKAKTEHRTPPRATATDVCELLRGCWESNLVLNKSSKTTSQALQPQSPAPKERRGKKRPGTVAPVYNPRMGDTHGVGGGAGQEAHGQTQDGQADPSISLTSQPI